MSSLSSILKIAKIKQIVRIYEIEKREVSSNEINRLTQNVCLKVQSQSVNRILSHRVTENEPQDEATLKFLSNPEK